MQLDTLVCLHESVLRSVRSPQRLSLPGSAVLYKLLAYKKQYPITALSRSEEKVELLNKLRDNVKGLKGSLTDLDLLEEQASKHDIIFNTADADDVSW